MKIFLLDGKKAGEFIELKPPGISIGRETDNDLILDEEASSRYHAKVEWKDNEWALKDLGSTNGTKLNGTKITAETILQQGDKITIGTRNMLFGASKDSEKKKDSSEADAAMTVKAPPIGSAAAAPEPERQKPEPPLKKEAKSAEKKSFMSFFESKDKESPPEKVQEPRHESGFFGKIDFFGKKDDVKDGGDKLKKHASPLFYVIVVISAVMCVLLFLLFDKIQSERAKANEKKTPVKQSAGAPLMVTYEKQISTRDNIFRYELVIKDETIGVTRDDLKHQIRFQRQKKVDKDSLLKLVDELKQTDLMNLGEQQSGISSGETDELKILTIAYEKNLNSIRIKNAFEPTSFKEAVTILEDFSNNILNIPPISLTADEMKDSAEEAFRKAEQLFQNYQAKDDNLINAVKRYQLVIDLLECFEPKPEMYDRAYRQSQEANRILDEEIKAHMKNAQQYQKLSNFEEAKGEYQKIISKLDADDKRYQVAKERKMKIDNFLRTRTKK